MQSLKRDLTSTFKIRHEPVVVKLKVGFWVGTPFKHLSEEIHKTSLLTLKEATKCLTIESPKQKLK